ncbi:Arogenate dehydratase 3 [Nymphaea thermarum]|nr:Arogenate dehydratase 3 [Nymphaea thermarum]
MAGAIKFSLDGKLSWVFLSAANTTPIRSVRFSEQTNNSAAKSNWRLGTKLINEEVKERTRSKRDPDTRHKNPRLRVAYQGFPGAYSEIAAKLACLNCSAISCKAIADAIEAVETGRADRAIMPVESTMEGTKVRNYNFLLEHDLYITQEVNMFVDYNLIANPGLRKEDVKRVISHPVALAHCGQGLARAGLDAYQQAVDDTAGAVQQLLAQNMHDTAAIASKEAAKLYGLQVLAEGLQDEPWNVTRFLILSKKPEKVRQTEKTQKTSMVIAHQGGMQPLLQVLSALSSRNINLAKLEVVNSMEDLIRILDTTRRGGSVREFQHVFYVDFEGSMEDQKVLDAVAEISVFSPFIRVLGCYTADSKINYI